MIKMNVFTKQKLDDKSQFIGKELDAEKDWGQEEKGAAEDEMLGWHHWLHGREFEQLLGDSGKQWKKGKIGMQQFMGSQRAGHNLATEQNVCV